MLPGDVTRALEENSIKFYRKIFRIRRKRVSNVLVVILILLFAIIILCMPMIYYANTTTVKVEQLSSHPLREDRTMTVCGSNLPDNVMSFFICYMFLFGFVLPLLFITICYFFLIQHLRRNGGNNCVTLLLKLF